MKILNISLTEFLKNKLYFTCFTVGLAFLLSVICVLMNYKEQVFEGFFTQFSNGNVLPLDIDALPTNSASYNDLPIIAKGSGVTYNVMMSHGDKSVFLPSYRGGLCVISRGKDSSFQSANSIGEHEIIIAERLAEEIDCENGDTVNIDGKGYLVKSIVPSSDAAYSFVVYDPYTTADEITIILSCADQLLKISKCLDPESFNDKDGILALCNGYRGMKTGMNIVTVLLAVICAFYIFVFIRMYYSRRAELIGILFRTGLRKTRLFVCLGALFSFLCFVGSAVGFMASALLDELVEKWASELLEMHVDKVNYLMYFAVAFVMCAAVTAASLFFNIRKTSESEVRNR